MDKYSKASLLPVCQKIHWFSFINSIIIIVLLMGLLALLIVRRLKNDMKKFSNSDEEEDKEVGWKYNHGDVFRYPPSMSLFCAVLGVGTQLLAMSLLWSCSFICYCFEMNEETRLKLYIWSNSTCPDPCSLCLEATSDCTVVAGKIVICDSGIRPRVQEGQEVKDAGAIVSQFKGAYVKVEPQTFNFTRANQKLS